MEPVLDLEKLSRIAGVKSYYLVKHDGTLVSANGHVAPEIVQYIALSGLNGEAACSLLGQPHFNHMILSRQCKESIIVFPMANHLLAIVKEPGAATSDLNPKIRDLIHEGTS